MNKTILYFLLLILGSAGVALRFSSSFEKMPIGCDEFGYLNMAKAISGATTFTDHTSRPYLDKLLDTLRKSSITENEISWMVTPHAYHVLPGTNKIINQYPPGTSLLLSIFPIQIRQLIFPLLVILLVTGLVIFYKKQSGTISYTVFDLFFPVLIFLLMVAAPFTTELSRINSLAPTFGLLFAGGLFLNKRPLLAAFLIAITINFRVINALMLIPVMLFLPLKGIFDIKNIKNNLKIVLTFGVLIIVGTLPVLIYNYLLTGNPLAITYSAIDQKVSPINNISTNISFYFNFDQRWLMVHILVLLILFILWLTRKISLKTILKLLTFILINYAFFVIHDVHMDYYPYASSLVLMGFVMGKLDKIALPKRKKILFKFFFLAVTLLIFFIGLGRYLKKVHVNFETAQQKYKSLCNYDIVWADLYSGTSEYVCNNNGFRYGTTTPRARTLAIKFLIKNNYKQAILLEDNTVDENTVLREITDADISYHIITDDSIGKILVID